MNNKTFERLRKIAKKTADASPHHIRLGAVVFHKNRILSTGFNTSKGITRYLKIFRFATCHAEISAIRNVKNRELLKGSEIFVFRESKAGTPMISRPCGLCTQVMYEHGIKKVWYTVSEFPYWKCELVEDMYNKIDKKECFETNCRKPMHPPEGKKKGNI